MTSPEFLAYQAAKARRSQTTILADIIAVICILGVFYCSWGIIPSMVVPPSRISMPVYATTATSAAWHPVDAVTVEPERFDVASPPLPFWWVTQTPAGPVCYYHNHSKTADDGAGTTTPASYDATSALAASVTSAILGAINTTDAAFSADSKREPAAMRGGIFSCVLGCCSIVAIVSLASLLAKVRFREDIFTAVGCYAVLEPIVNRTLWF